MLRRMWLRELVWILMIEMLWGWMCVWLRMQVLNYLCT